MRLINWTVPLCLQGMRDLCSTGSARTLTWQVNIPEMTSRSQGRIQEFILGGALLLFISWGASKLVLKVLFLIRTYIQRKVRKRPTCTPPRRREVTKMETLNTIYSLKPYDSNSWLWGWVKTIAIHTLIITYTGCSGKIVFFHNSLQPLPRLHRCTVTPIGW